MRETSFLNISVRNNVKVIGEGTTTLLFGHGFGCDQHTWRSVSPAFEKDYRVVLFDYVGAGKSDLSAYDSERYSSLEGYAKDIVEICEELELQNVIFIGHSVSSMIGLLALKQNPSIFKKIVFIGPSPRYINEPGYDGGIDRDDLDELLDVMDSNYMGWSQMVAPSIMGNPDRPELGQDLAASFCAMDPGIARQFARVTFMSDNRHDLLYLNVPSLTIQCNDDFLTSQYIAEYIHQHTTGNEVVLLPSSGHCPHLSDPKAVIKAIKSFI
ncbi:MAG: alpha/beta hydrolase [Pedobacter sp.]|uniref:alpha/beta fold hydrolase n=1 Tax=Pedobacter sp. TaxID=1411316 RepID=UPI0033987948